MTESPNRASLARRELDPVATLIVGLWLLCAALLVVTALRIHGDYDVWWHLRMGMDWVNNGLSPWRDHYSFTLPGAPITGPPVAFQVLIGALVSAFGENGGQFTFKLLVFLGVLTLMTLWLRKISANVWVFLLVLPLTVAALQTRVMVRPEMLSYLLALIALFLYQRSKLQLGTRAMLPVVALLLVWTHYHSPIIGYVIFAGLFVDIALRLATERQPPAEWLKWVAWGAAALLVGFTGLDGNHALVKLLPFMSTDDWSLYIAEYRSTLGGLGALSFAGRFVPYTLFAVSIIAIAGSTLLRRPGYALVVAVMALAAIQFNRMVTPAAIVNLAIFGHVLALMAARKTSMVQNPLSRRVLAGLASAITILTLLSALNHAHIYLEENKRAWTRLPDALITHLQNTGERGRIFNAYEMGGYLLYRLSPSFSVYIDGRTDILYPFELAARHTELMRDPELLRQEKARYDIDHAVVNTRPTMATRMIDAGFDLDFADVRYLLFKAENAQFPQLGRLYAAPECRDALDSTALAKEIDIARQQFPAQSALSRLIEVIDAESRAASDETFFQDINLVMLSDISSIRYFAYRALEAGRYNAALAQFRRLHSHSNRDQVAMIFAMMQTRQDDQAHAQAQQLWDQESETMKPPERDILTSMLASPETAGAAAIRAPSFCATRAP